MFSILLLQAAAAGAGAGAALAAGADTALPTQDAIHYDVTLAPSDSGRYLEGSVETRWRLRLRGPITLALDSAMEVVRVLEGGRAGELHRVAWRRESDRLVIPDQSAPGDTITTRVEYRGEPREGLVFRGTGRNRTIFADNWPDRAHGWLPVQDHPSDKASVSFHVEAPIADEVIANGTLRGVDTLPRGRAVWSYDMPRDIPVYTMVIGIARFAVTPLPDAACKVRCVHQSVWTAPADSAFALAGPFRRVGEIVDFFSRLMGPFPYASLAHVESSTEFGGMENTTAIFYNDSLYRARRLGEQTVAHETAHQWFGDAVTERDWHHLWLSEGFATYLAAMWGEHAAGADGPAVLADEMRRAAGQYFASSVVDRPILDPSVRDLLSLLNENNYQKGAWVLHQLRGMIGDSAFAAGLRGYYRAYRDSTALSADFARVMGEAAGRNLDWYFTQALTQPGYPVLDVRWRYDGGRLALTIRQTQPAEWGLYRMPGLEIVVDGRPIRVDVDGRETRRVVDGIARAPAAVEVDPHAWWLLKATVAREG
ncbi:MAG TPA: M1 family metallopeptidase [Gemmatimonadales bacterium]|nr:M1 family metallopeptidase [Gemmatimonadales bacterium]